MSTQPSPEANPDERQAAPETRMEHWLRRGRELDKMRKADLCAMYRRMGYLWSPHPPEKWRKDEVVNSIVDLEWGSLPDDRKAPEPEVHEPPCAECGGTPDDHTEGEGHRYHYYGPAPVVQGPVT